jgi:hypothetical protein
MVVLVLAEDRLGTIPDWIAGIGTFAAFLVTLRLLAKELAARREDREEERRQQASLVAVWVMFEVDSTNIVVDSYLALRNGSEQPIYDLRVTIVAEDSPFASDPEAVRNTDGTLKEAGPVTHTESLLPPGDEPVRRDIPHELLPSSFTAPGLSFTDSHGRRWKRYPIGILEEVTRSRRSRKDYYNAWIAGELKDLDY